MSDRRVSPTRQLADLKLGGDGLAGFIADRRKAGKSWRVISLELRDATDIDVTYETLRSWFADAEAKAS